MTYISLKYDLQDKSFFFAKKLHICRVMQNVKEIFSRQSLLLPLLTGGFVLLYRANQLFGIETHGFLFAAICMAIISVLCGAGLHWVLKNAIKSAIVSVCVLAFFFLFPIWFELLKTLPRALVYAITRYFPDLRNVYFAYIKMLIWGFFAVMSGLLVGIIWKLYQGKWDKYLPHIHTLLMWVLIGEVSYETYKLVSQSGLYATLQSRKKSYLAPIQAKSKVPKDSLPDIYLMVWDEYMSPEITDKRMGFVEYMPFLDSLKQKGFLIPRHARSNYFETSLSMPAMLNLDYVPLQNLTLNEAQSEVYCMELLEENRLMSFLTEQGYACHNLSIFSLHQTVNPVNTLTFTPAQLWDYIILGSLWGNAQSIAALSHTQYNAQVQEALQTHLNQQQAHPQFVYFHIMLPHTPFVYKENGEVMSATDAQALSQPQKYLAQMRFTQKCVLRWVNEIQTKNKRPAMIILTGDHGLRYFTQDMYMCKPSDVYEIFHAIHLPPNSPVKYDSVNFHLTSTFRHILNGYFHTQYDSLPYQSFGNVPVEE